MPMTHEDRDDQAAERRGSGRRLIIATTNRNVPGSRPAGWRSDEPGKQDPARGRGGEEAVEEADLDVAGEVDAGRRPVKPAPCIRLTGIIQELA